MYKEKLAIKIQIFMYKLQNTWFQSLYFAFFYNLNLYKLSSSVSGLIVLYTNSKTQLLVDDRLYSAILRSLEQTHCARMWFYMSD